MPTNQFSFSWPDGLSFRNLFSRAPWSIVAAVALASVPVTGCGGDSESGSQSADETEAPAPGNPGPQGGGLDGPGTSGTYIPCEVDKALSSCRNCHGAQRVAGAPMSLLTYDDFNAPSLSDPSKKVAQKVVERIKDGSMPPPGGYKLEASDAAVIESWIAAGTPSSPTQCTGTAPPSDPTTDLGCTPDLTMRPDTPYAIKDNLANEYVCYGFDIDATKKKHITAFAPKIDNAAVVHHLLLFEVDTPYSKTPTPCSALASAAMKLVTGWAPGGPPVILPPEAGWPVKANGTSHYVLQIHYNNAARASGQVDASGYEMCTTEDLRPNDAGMVAFGSMNFVIPAHGTLKQQCDYNWAGTEATVFGISPHMHTRGRAMKTSVFRNGVEDNLVDIQNFSFDNQLQYEVPLKKIGPGDKIQTTCAWQNDTANNIGFGENTEEEMCYDFTMYYPRQNLGFMDWMTPSFNPFPFNCRNL